MPSQSGPVQVLDITILFYIVFPSHSGVTLLLLLLQGEVLPIQYRNLFDGLYTVRLDEGREAQVAHCNMRLLYNTGAEASSWVRNSPTSPPPQSDNVAEAEAGLFQQQQWAQPEDDALRSQVHQRGHDTELHVGAYLRVGQQQQQQQSDGTHTRLSADVRAATKAPTIKLPGGFLSTARTSAAEPAGCSGRAGSVQTPSERPTAAVENTRQEEDAEEQVVPQLRRTKRTVAQKRLASAGPSDPSPTGRRVQRKLSHRQTPGASDSYRTKGRGPPSPPLAATLSPAAQLSSEASIAEPKGLGLQSTGWEPESEDEDLFVDLSRANILRPWSSGLKAVQQFASPVATPDGGEAHANVAASLAQVLDRGQATDGLSPIQSWQNGFGSSPSAQLEAGGDPFAFFGM